MENIDKTCIEVKREGGNIKREGIMLGKLLEG